MPSIADQDVTELGGRLSILVPERLEDELLPRLQDAVGDMTGTHSRTAATGERHQAQEER